jgi:hypothetical protein
VTGRKPRQKKGWTYLAHDERGPTARIRHLARCQPGHCDHTILYKSMHLLLEAQCVVGLLIGQQAARAGLLSPATSIPLAAIHPYAPASP